MEVNIDKFFIKKNDTLPVLSIAITDEGYLGEKTPFILTAVTAVTFTMVDECGDFKILEGSSNITCDYGGNLEYVWSENDTDVSGKFKGEFRLYFSGGSGSGSVMTIPTISPIDIFISKTINPF